jgi:hypothetical protein
MGAGSGFKKNRFVSTTLMLDPNKLIESMRIQNLAKKRHLLRI